MTTAPTPSFEINARSHESRAFPAYLLKMHDVYVSPGGLIGSFIVSVIRSTFKD